MVMRRPPFVEGARRNLSAHDPTVVATDASAVVGRAGVVATPSGAVGRLLLGSMTQRPSCRWNPKPQTFCFSSQTHRLTGAGVAGAAATGAGAAASAATVVVVAASFPSALAWPEGMCGHCVVPGGQSHR